LKRNLFTHRERVPEIHPWVVKQITIPGPTREEFDSLKKTVDEMMKLLKRAKKYDQENNEPDCEIEDKMQFLREVAKRVGVDLDKELIKNV